MAGLGRRTHYRKHLTDSVLNDFPEPHPPQSRLAKIVSTRGSNQFDVLLAGSDVPELAILPTKFRKLVWLKRNDYVIVETADDLDSTEQHKVGNNAASSSSSSSNNNQETGSIRCMIAHILYQEQIKHLITKGLWPTDDPEFVVEDRKLNEAISQPKPDDDGIVYDDTYLVPGDDDFEGGDEEEYEEHERNDDPMMFVNTNRIARLTVQDSSSDEEEED